MFTFIDNEIEAYIRVPVTVVHVAYNTEMLVARQRTSAIYCLHVQRSNHRHIRDNVQLSHRLTMTICI